MAKILLNLSNPVTGNIYNISASRVLLYDNKTTVQTAISELQGYFSDESANSAIELRNPRTINGVSFNGTIDINVPNNFFTQLENIDLNTYNESSYCGEYFSITNNTITNKPSGVDSFYLRVFRGATGDIGQLLFSDGIWYSRYYSSNSWSSWGDIYSSINKPSASEIGAASSYHTHTGTQVTGLTTSRALVSNSSGQVSVSSVTSTELGYLDGVTSNIQTQLNNKASVSHTHSNYAAAVHNHTSNQIKFNAGEYGLVAISSSDGALSTSTITTSELGYLDGATSNIQTQLNNKPGEVVLVGSLKGEIFNDYDNNTVSANYTHAEGQGTTASAVAAHAEGRNTTASGIGSHAEGDNTTASGHYGSHAEGQDTVAAAYYSHAEGEQCSVLEDADGGHAEGLNTIVSGIGAHAEGYETEASGWYSHAEGSLTTASGNYTHAEGCNTTASAGYSHAEGYMTIASSVYQHVQGIFNVEDPDDIYLHIVGYGTNENNRKNVHTIDTDGNAVFAGSCTATLHPTSSSKRFKENFRDVDISESDKILSLKAQKFDFKEEYGGMKDRVGFIAEEMESIFPNCVSYDAKGTITGIDYSAFVPYIIEVCKRQQEEIDELKKDKL